MSEHDDVLCRIESGIGRITLNRPGAINALTHGMITDIRSALDAWRDDDAVRAVLLDGAGSRGLCAGGDVRALREAVLSGDGAAGVAFWRDEYELCATIAEYPKPYIALMDGVVMGGGVGISAHGGIRVVTERSRVAMPETRIGFVPDVGGTWLLARAPGELGTYLALTGATMTAADAVHCGFADVVVPSHDLPGLVGELLGGGDPGEVVRRFAVAPSASPLSERRHEIDPCFASRSVPEVVAKLRRTGSDAALRTVAELEDRSPFALEVALGAVRRARGLTLRAALRHELHVSSLMMERSDFAEGIRTRLVDKQDAPRWHPARLEDVDRAEVERVVG